MLGWSITFFIIAIIAGLLGLTGIAGASAGIAQMLFVLFLILFVVFLIMGRRRPPVAEPAFLPFESALSPDRRI